MLLSQVLPQTRRVGKYRVVRLVRCVLWHYVY